MEIQLKAKLVDVDQTGRTPQLKLSVTDNNGVRQPQPEVVNTRHETIIKLDSEKFPYTLSIETQIGKRNPKNKHHEELWSLCTVVNGQVVNPKEDFEVVVAVINSPEDAEQIPLLEIEFYALIPKVLGNSPVDVAEFGKILADIAAEYPAWLANDPLGAPKEVRKLIDSLFAGTPCKEGLGIDTKTDTSVNQSTQKLADEDTTPIEVFVSCSYCGSLFNSPSSPYFRNVTWYNNCLYNPTCTQP